jgi:glycosyltransferase involved in cell wall biosynthesis
MNKPFRLIYVANIRLPTEKAHGLQIMQNCEAFAQEGADVALWAAGRVNAPALRGIDPFAHYGVERCFALRRLPTLDLLPLVPGRSDLPARLIFALQLVTFTLAALLNALFTRADVFYSRDSLLLLALSCIKPRSKLAYEAHSRAHGRIGGAIQRAVIRRVGAVFTTTGKLREELIALGAAPECTHVAHDGIRAARFDPLSSRAEARTALGWSPDATIVGYVGRLQTMDMDKGVGDLVTALAPLPGAHLALVGGPDAMAEALRARWAALGGNPSAFLYAGQVTPDRVPLHLAALDICAMPFPWTTHFAYYASPIKLFEYMAAGRAIVASDLPSTAEIVRAGETALLYPPGDVHALAGALRTLHDDPTLRERMGAAARAEAMTHYTWAARARRILREISRGGDFSAAG